MFEYYLILVLCERDTLSQLREIILFSAIKRILVLKSFSVNLYSH